MDTLLDLWAIDMRPEVMVEVPGVALSDIAMFRIDIVDTLTGVGIAVVIVVVIGLDLIVEAEYSLCALVDIFAGAIVVGASGISVDVVVNTDGLTAAITALEFASSATLRDALVASSNC